LNLCERGSCDLEVKPGNRFIKGHNNKGKSFSAEHKQSISDAITLRHREVDGYTQRIAEACRGTIRSLGTRKRLSKALTGRKLSKEHIFNRTLGQMKCRTDGYCDAWSDREYKEDLRKEVCGNCSITEAGSLVKYNKRLHLHHSDGDKGNCHPDNFDTLCVSCHAHADWELRKEYNNGSV